MEAMGGGDKDGGAHGGILFRTVYAVGKGRDRKVQEGNISP